MSVTLTQSKFLLQEEVLPLQSSSEDSDDSDDEENSEDEDKDVLGDDEGDLPDPKAWGRKRKNYYDTDYVDQDFGGECTISVKKITDLTLDLQYFHMFTGYLFL